jgi:hypothetical protein
LLGLVLEKMLGTQYSRIYYNYVQKLIFKNSNINLPDKDKFYYPSFNENGEKIENFNSLDGLYCAVGIGVTIEDLTDLFQYLFLPENEGCLRFILNYIVIYSNIYIYIVICLIQQCESEFFKSVKFYAYLKWQFINF